MNQDEEPIKFAPSTEAEVIRLAAQSNIRALKKASLLLEIFNIKYAFTRTMLMLVISTDVPAENKPELVNEIRRDAIATLTSLVPSQWKGEDGMRVTFAIGEVNCAAEETKQILSDKAQDKQALLDRHSENWSLYPVTHPQHQPRSRRVTRKARL